MSNHHSSFTILKSEPNEPLYIRDIGHETGKSVTNDAEWVVEQLHAKGLLPEGRRLLYFDSEDMLSEIMHKNGVFVGFNPAFL